MKVLLDECVRKEVLALLSELEVAHVRDLGWDSLQNGALLEAASKEFDVLVTVDKNMRFQQSLAGRSLAVVVLDVPNVEVETYARFAPAAILAIRNSVKGEFVVVPDP